MDARRNQAYYAIYEVNETLPVTVTEPAAAPIEEVIHQDSNAADATNPELSMPRIFILCHLLFYRNLTIIKSLLQIFFNENFSAVLR